MNLPLLFTGTCSFVAPVIFESSLRLPRNQRGSVRIIRWRFTSRAKSSPSLSRLYPAWRSSRRFHISGTRNAKRNCPARDWNFVALLYCSFAVFIPHNCEMKLRRVVFGFFFFFVRFYLLHIVIMFLFELLPSWNLYSHGCKDCPLFWCEFRNVFILFNKKFSYYRK